MQVIVEDGGKRPDAKLVPAEREEEAHGLELLLLNGATAIGGDVGMALAPIYAGVGDGQNARGAGHAVPRGIVTAPGQRIAHKASGSLECAATHHILDDEAVDPIAQTLTEEVLGPHPFVEIGLDEASVRGGLALAVDDRHVVVEQILIGIATHGLVERLDTVRVHLVVVAEHPEPFFPLCKRHTALPLPDEVLGSEVPVETRVLQIEPIRKGHHNIAQVVRAAVVPDIDREVLACLSRKTLQGFPQEVRLIDGDDDGKL